jgi:hypothetical protein
VTIRPEGIDPENWLTREVYARFGLALYMAQVLEHGIINLASWTGVHDRSYRNWDEAEADSVELFKMTMGKLRQALISRRPDVANLEEMLARAVRLRNFLAHEYFRERPGAFRTEDGMNQMIEELTKAAAFFKDVDAKLERLTRQIIEAMGVDKHMPEVLEDVRRAGFGRPLPGL